MGWEQEERKRREGADSAAEVKKRKNLIPTSPEAEQRFQDYVGRVEQRLAKVDPKLRETARYFYRARRWSERDNNWTPASAVCAETLAIYSSNNRSSLESGWRSKNTGRGVEADAFLWMTSGGVMMLGIWGYEGSGDQAHYVIRWYNVTGDRGIEGFVQYLVTGSTAGLRGRIGGIEIGSLALLLAALALCVRGCL